MTPQIIMNSYQSQRQIFMPNIQMLFTFALNIVKFFDPCQKLVMLSWSRSCTHAILSHREIVVTPITPQNKNSMTVALQKQFGLCKKKIKDVYPKKVDHMLNEYVKKKRKKEKMHTQRRYAACLQRHVKKKVDRPYWK